MYFRGLAHNCTVYLPLTTKSWDDKNHFFFINLVWIPNWKVGNVSNKKQFLSYIPKFCFNFFRLFVKWKFTSIRIFKIETRDLCNFFENHFKCWIGVAFICDISKLSIIDEFWFCHLKVSSTVRMILSIRKLLLKSH